MANLKKRRLIKAWLPVALWMVVIFFASTDFGSAEHTSRVIEPLVRWIKPDATAGQIDLVHFLVRKAAHLTEYAILGLLLLRALRMSTAARANSRPLQLLVIALVCSAGYATMDEFHQSFVGGRTPCLQDVLIDTTGAFVSLVLATLAGRTTNKVEDDSAPDATAVAGE